MLFVNVAGLTLTMSFLKERKKKIVTKNPSESEYLKQYKTCVDDESIAFAIHKEDSIQLCYGIIDSNFNFGINLKVLYCPYCGEKVEKKDEKPTE